MNILIVGNGGREHVFAWKIKQSSHCERLLVVPGNAGTATIAENHSIAVNDFEKIGDLCLSNTIGLVIVGPEAPLVNGIHDYFERHEKLKKIPLVGPGKAGAQLEGSKDFSKQFMLRHGIPTAAAKTFQANELTQALAYLDSCAPPIVLKADGLAAGKGVVITEQRDEAKSIMKEMLVDKKFGEAGKKVLVEEFLTGIELSVFVLTDGKNYVILPEAKDYKRIGEGDTGPNTGGMGAVSPVQFADETFMKKVEERIIKPTILGLQKEKIGYQGFIFIGLMNSDGEPRVIEYNARMGDPETQVVFPRIQNDMVELMLMTATGKLGGTTIKTDPDHAVTVVMVSAGYPNEYEKGKIIQGLDTSQEAIVFQAGTALANGTIVTDGGRVLAITGKGADLHAAREKAYSGVAKLHWDGLYFRKDIGLDLIKLSSSGS